MRPLLLLLALAGAAHAAPLVDVRARTRITVESVERTGSGVHVRGQLIDAGTGEGVAARDVIVDVATGGSSASHPVTTGRSGGFDLYLAELEAGRHQVAARFAGDEIYGTAEFDARAFDVDRAQLVLSVNVPQAIDATVPVVEATITASSGEGPERVHVTLRAGDASGPGALRAVGDVTTDADGVGRLEIPREKLGRPGEKRVMARADGGEIFNPIEAQATFLLYTSTQLSDLQLPDATVPYERDLRVGGKLLDAEGKPVVGALVALDHAGTPAAETVTDTKGRFSLRAAASRYGPGPATFTVVHASTIGWRRGTRSSPIVVEIARPRPVPPWVSVAASAVTAAAVLAYALLRTRPWQRLLEAWRARRRRPESDRAAEGSGRPEEAAPAPGLKLARPSLISSLRRAADHGFSGRVSDLVRGVPLPGARLSLLLDGHEHLVLLADEHGHFETELPPGMWRVVVSAHGYVTETVSAPVPHRGELRGARIDLLPVRERVFALYREVAAQLLPRADLWGVWTPREIFDHVRARQPAGALGRLTDLVEETTFAERVPGEEVLGRVAEVVTAARVELGR